MPVDNEIYNRDGDIWWGDDQALTTLRTMVNPARVAYLYEVLVERLGLDPRGLRALDVGAGGGILAEEVARLGCAVTGVDPSAPSLATARAHAAHSGLAITYLHGRGEALPVPDVGFDLVYCCDVLEHVATIDPVIAEIARVLRPGGVFVYDTINRTLLSSIAVVGALQEWDATRCMPAGLHDWASFVRPRELRASLARHGLRHQASAGLAPSANPLAALWALRQRRRGAIDYAELGRRLVMRRTRLSAISYMGYAVKTVGR